MGPPAQDPVFPAGSSLFQMLPRCFREDQASGGGLSWAPQGRRTLEETGAPSRGEASFWWWGWGWSWAGGCFLAP